MKLALTLAALMLSSLPAFAQQSELEKLKEEFEKLKVESAAKAARILALEELLSARRATEKLQMEEAAKAALLDLTSRRFAEAKPPQVTPPVVAKPVVWPTKALEGKVTAVANEIGLVVISIGKDDGVKEGDEFTVYRSGDFVAKITIDRADRQWSAGKVILKKGEPRVMDAVSNHILVSGGRGYKVVEGVPAPAPVPLPVPGPSVTTPSRASSDELKALRKELDEVRNQVRQLSDQLVASWQDAGIAVDEASEELRSHLGIAKGLLVRRVREGSAADKAGLKANDVVPNLSEAQLLDLITKRSPVTYIRKGQQAVGSPK